MNCQDFQKSLDVFHLAGSAGQSRSRVLIERHAEECESCARLIGFKSVAAKDSLSALLTRLSDQDRGIGVRMGQESILLESFRARHGNPSGRPSAQRESFLSGLLGFFSIRGLSVAASAVVVMAASFWMWKSQNIVTTASPDEKASPSSSISLNPSITPAKKETAVESNPAGSLDPKEDGSVSIAARNSRGNELRNVSRRGNVTVDMGQFEVDEPVSAGNLSDFVAFDYAEHMAPPDAVRLMRVQMPPSRLVNMGIPVPVSLRSREMVNTDLLVGNDGNPRAIRVVY